MYEQSFGDPGQVHRTVCAGVPQADRAVEPVGPGARPAAPMLIADDVVARTPSDRTGPVEPARKRLTRIGSVFNRRKGGG